MPATATSSTGALSSPTSRWRCRCSCLLSPSMSCGGTSWQPCRDHDCPRVADRDDHGDPPPHFLRAGGFAVGSHTALDPAGHRPGRAVGLATFATATAAAWFSLVATGTSSYLGFVAERTFNAVKDAAQETHAPFEASAGSLGTPVLEQLVAFLGVLVVIAVVLSTLRRARRIPAFASPPGSSWPPAPSASCCSIHCACSLARGRQPIAPRSSSSSVLRWSSVSDSPGWPPQTGFAAGSSSWACSS